MNKPMKKSKQSFESSIIEEEPTETTLPVILQKSQTMTDLNPKKQQ